MMRFSSVKAWTLTLSGVSMVAMSGCLGPNPGFFVGTSAANAAISTLVNIFLTQTLNAGGG